MTRPACGTPPIKAARAGAWVQGKVVLFDDSYEHDVVHAGARDRVVLDLSVDHPSVFRGGGRGEL